MTQFSQGRIKNRRSRVAHCGQAAVGVFVSFVGACAAAAPVSTASPKQSDHAVDARTAEYFRAKTATVVERAILCKPRPSEDGTFDVTQAPLFVVDVPVANARPEIWQHPTHLPILAGQELWDDLSDVYVDRTDVKIAGRSYVQVVYAWTCIRFPNPGVKNVEGRICGIRATLAPDGRPLVWETLMDPEYDVLYVSQTVENAARAKFGEPLPGHTFAAERSHQEAPATVIARVLDDGPIPLGPYVYFPSRAGGITTLLCRCSPSQMNDVIETVEYQLHQADELRPGWHSRILAATDKPLDQRLRWPYP